MEVKNITKKICGFIPATGGEYACRQISPKRKPENRNSSGIVDYYWFYCNITAFVNTCLIAVHDTKQIVNKVSISLNKKGKLIGKQKILQNENPGGPMRKIAMPLTALLLFIFLPSLCNAQNYAIKMNEIYSRGTDDAPDWIELYNTADSAVDISNYKIYDSGGKNGTKDKKGFDSGTIIPSYGFYVVTTDGSEAADFGLSNNGEEVWLEDENGNVIEDITFPTLASGESYGRMPDGGDWTVLTSQTKGSTNSTVVSVEKETALPAGFVR